MGWIAAAAQVARDLLSLPRPLVLDDEPAATFDSTPTPVADLLAAMYGAGAGARVSRSEALSVAAVQRGRNEMCSVATLPLNLYRGIDIVDHPMFRQFDPDVPNVVHLAATIEDLLFEGLAWWRITGQDFDQYPVSVRHVDVNKVTLEPPGRGDRADRTPAGDTTQTGRFVWVDGEKIPASLMIRFDSPNPGLLRANGRAVRRAILLDRLASTYADNPRPLDYFTDSDDPSVTPMDEDEIDPFLAEWQAMRKLRSTAWIPGNVKRVDVNAPSPAEIQLVELQRQVTLEIANGIGVDPEDLGVSTTSRTYFNAQDRRITKINESRAPIMKAITDRLAMGDVTRRGYAPQFDLTDYLKPDPLTQAQYWEVLNRMGAMGRAEIRAAARLSGPVPADAAPRPTPTPAAAPAKSSAPLPAFGARFDDDRPAMTFSGYDFAAVTPAPTVDEEKRTITGLALPYNAVARKYGLGIRFKPGALEYNDVSRVKHFKDHATPVGVTLSVDDQKTGPVVVLSVGSGPDGSPQRLERDQLLHDAANGLYDGLSVGVDFSLDPESGDAVWNEADQVYDVVRATWRETSTTSMPAFDDARVTKVAASLSGGNQMKCPHCGGAHGPGIACATFAARVTPPAAPPAAGDPAAGDPAAPPGADPQLLAAFGAFVREQARSGALPTVGQMVEQRQFVNAGGPGVAQVTEPTPYRFDWKGNLRKGSHDFSTDLHAGWQQGGDGDQAARDRVQSFTRQAFASGDALYNMVRADALTGPQQFAVTSGNVSALNPNRNRPDMFVDQMEYTYPVWEAINKGTLEDITPFVIPKFNASSGLVNNHTEGTEPTPGAYTATAQTITPSSVSGKVEYTREAWDQGGNPQASGLIWTQMIRGYYEALEAYAVSSLAAVAASIPDMAIATPALADSALDQALADLIVPLHYIRGGNRFKRAFTQIDLYKAMVKAKDTAGRRLYPSLGPANAAGVVDEDYGAIRAHGVTWLPAWALAATGSVVASSYLFDPDKVAGWATAPQRIDITWRIAWVDIGVWGYKAFGVTDFAGTRELTYDPV